MGSIWYQSVSRAHNPIRLLYTLQAYLVVPFGHNTRRGSRQTDDRAIGIGRLCYSIGGLKIIHHRSEQSARRAHILFVYVFDFHSWAICVTAVAPPLSMINDGVAFDFALTTFTFPAEVLILFCVCPFDQQRKPVVHADSKLFRISSMWLANRHSWKSTLCYDVHCVGLTCVFSSVCWSLQFWVYLYFFYQVMALLA